MVEEGVMDKVIKLAIRDTFDVRRECSWVLSNAISQGNSEDVGHMLSHDLVQALIAVLSHNDARTLSMALGGLEGILKKGRDFYSTVNAIRDLLQDGVNPVAQEFERCGGLERLEELQMHANSEDYRQAASLIEVYYGVDDDLFSASAPSEDISIFNLNLSTVSLN